MTTAEQALVYQNAARYCSYQERNIHEVRNKLHALGGSSTEDEAQLIHALQKARFLDEARYAAAFVRGKFFHKKWGKCKISAALRQKYLDPACIDAALAIIADEDYQATIVSLAQQKKQQLLNTDGRQAHRKMMNYLLQKGYEPDRVREVVQALLTQ